MFFNFFILTNSICWEFSKHIFHEKIRNSHKNPLFALCYSPSCSHCHGLPEQIKEYADSQPNRTDIIFTSVNCDVSGNCDRFGLREIPQYILVVGENNVYWPKMKISNFSEWEKFISHYIEYDIEEISTKDELDAAIKNTFYGGTTFHIETPSISDSSLSIIRQLVKRYIVFNDTFTYRLNYSIQNSELYAYRSPYCIHKFEGSISKHEISGFINENRFGYMHKYSFNEWIEENRIRRTAIFFEYGVIDEEHISSLNRLARDHCKDLSIGWASGNDAKSALKMAKINQTELPIVLISNKKKDCSAMTSSTLNPSKIHSFSRMALNGQICESRFRGMWKKGLIHHRFKGIDFSFLLFSGALTSIFLVRMWETYSTKDE